MYSIILLLLRMYDLSNVSIPLFSRYHVLDDYPCEGHTDVYWIKCVDINDAR